MDALRVLQSRKFWAALIGLILIIVTTWGQDPYPTDAVVTAIMGVVAAYMGSVAYEDSQQAKARATVTAANVTAEATTNTVSTPGESNMTVTAPNDPFTGR